MRPAKSPRPRVTEAAEQETLIAWARALANRLPALHYLHASLNGIKLTPQQARRFSRQGMLAGVPDLFLPYPVGQYHGLFIELKARDGRVSKEQQSMLDYLTAQGYCARACWGWNEARELVMMYLGGTA